MGRLVLVTGGQSSGKTSWAGAAAAAAAVGGVMGDGDGEVVVIASAEAWDAEMAARIARHQADRPAGWRTLETFDLVAALAEAGPHAPVLVDALDTWLVHRGHDEGLDADDLDVAAAASAEAAVLADVDAFAAAVRARPGPCWIVAGQPGLGVVPLGAVTRRLVDAHGRACQRLQADEVVLLIAGAAFHAPGPGRSPAGGP